LGCAEITKIMFSDDDFGTFPFRILWSSKLTRKNIRIRSFTKIFKKKRGNP
jgi:hypothetical protein